MTDILIVSPQLAGGIGRVTLDLASAWRDAGQDVRFALGRTGTEYDAEIRACGRVDVLRTTNSLSGIPQLVALLRSTRPRIVLTDTPRVTTLSARAIRLSGCAADLHSVVHCNYSELMSELSEQKRKRRIRAIGRTYPFCKKVICVSRGVRDDFASISSLDPARLAVISNPLSPDDEATRSPALIEERESPRLLAVGRLVLQKDFPTLLRAFRDVSNRFGGSLTILGEGPERSTLEALVVELGLQQRAFLQGHSPVPRAWMAQADLLVLSSRFEGFGLVLVEAMSVGTPVVATDCRDGPREILQDGRLGPLVPVGDANALAAAIESVLERPPDRRTLICAADAYRAETIAQRYLEVFGMQPLMKANRARPD